MGERGGVWGEDTLQCVRCCCVRLNEWGWITTVEAVVDSSLDQVS